MKKLNAKGFSVVEGLLLLIAVTLIAGVGFYVYNSGKDAEKRTAETAVTSNEPKQTEKKTVPEGWLQFEQQGVSFYHPGDWSDGKKGDESSLVSFLAGDAVFVNVYNKKPNVYYSANAPYLCQFNNGVWEDYNYDTSVSGTTSATTKTTEVDVCEERMEKRTSEGNVIYETAGGAMGLSIFVSVIEVSGGYLVVSNSSPYEPDTASDAEVAVITANLKTKVQETANELARVN